MRRVTKNVKEFLKVHYLCDEERMPALSEIWRNSSNYYRFLLFSVLVTVFSCAFKETTDLIKGSSNAFEQFMFYASSYLIVWLDWMWRTLHKENELKFDPIKKLTTVEYFRGLPNFAKFFIALAFIPATFCLFYGVSSQLLAQYDVMSTDSIAITLLRCFWVLFLLSWFDLSLRCHSFKVMIPPTVRENLAFLKEVYDYTVKMFTFRNVKKYCEYC